MARSQQLTRQREAGVAYAVRFVRTFQMYMAGDVATFPAAIARRLVAAGRAERVNLMEDDDEHPAPEDAEWALRGVQPPPYRQGAGPDDDGL
jgi:hypothetical protein